MSRLGSIDSQYHLDDGSGPLSGGFLYFYESGTSTEKTTYIDSDQTFENTWPIELDAAGVPPPIFFTGTAKIVLKDKDGNTVRTMDPVTAYVYTYGDDILYRLGDIDSQFFYDYEDKTLPLSNGILEVYENGTSTPKTTYSENSLTTENDWPIVLDDTGFLGDVFFKGKARLVLKDSDGVLIRSLNDVTTFELDTGTPIVLCPDDIHFIVGEVLGVCVPIDVDADAYTYQWYLDSSALSGETSQCISLTATADMDGASLWAEATLNGITSQTCYILLIQDETCTNLVSASSELTLSTIYVGNNFSSASGAWNFFESLCGYRSVLNVKDDLIFLNKMTAYVTPESEMLITNDFGDNWSSTATPVDTVWQTKNPTQYAGFKFAILHARFVGNIFWILRDETGQTSRSGAVFSTIDGSSWTLRHSTYGTLTDANDSNATYQFSRTYANGMNVASDGVSIIYGGRGDGEAGEVNFCYLFKDGSTYKGHTTIPQSATVNDDMWQVAYNGAANAPTSFCFSIVELLSGWVYQTQGYYGNIVWGTDTSLSRRKIASIYWTGSSWNATYTGSWRSTGEGPHSNWNVNGYVLSTANDVALRAWEHDGTSLLIPQLDYDDYTSGNFGKYYEFIASTPTEIDYTSLITCTPAEGNCQSFRLFYVREAKKWVMIYAFYSSGTTKNDHFYMRVGGTGYDVADFGDYLKINLPANYTFRSITHGGMNIDYSQSQGKWVFALYITDSSDATYRQIVGVIDDDFACP